MSTVVVIGAGLAGLASASRLAEAGIDVTLVTKGLGGLQLSQGTIDILGYSPQRVTNPLAAIAPGGPLVPDSTAATGLIHPYAMIGAERVKAGVEYLAELLGESMLVGDPTRNFQLPTALGGVRPTALAAPSMAAGDVKAGDKWVIAGLRRLKDFHARLVAGNLARTTLPDGGSLQVRAVSLDLPAVKGEVDSNAVIYARACDDQGFRVRLAGELKPLLKRGEKVGLPAMLGLRDPLAWHDLSQKLGTQVFEIPLGPPSVPGLRLNDALLAHLRRLGVRLVNGNRAIGYRAEGDAVTGIEVATAGAPRVYRCDAVVYAPGGLESGAIAMDADGELSEALFGLPLARPDGELLHGRFWGAEQPVFRVGVAVDSSMRVLGPDSAPVWANLRAAGGLLGGANRIAEKSGEGIALGSAVAAADAIIEELS
ncbi:MAG: glycerol-3-phosphate dehydrogenase subunit GlpB [Propionibacteriaceae bacterium]|nr:glycerol-3-phosphate dehydrogenase subunit GlpB [Propionibacteriaceae bacterium]